MDEVWMDLLVVAAPFGDALAETLTHQLEITLNDIPNLAASQQTITAFLHVARTEQSAFTLNDVYLRRTLPALVPQYVARFEPETAVPFVIDVPLVSNSSFLNTWCVRSTTAGQEEDCRYSGSGDDGPLVYFVFPLTFLQLGVFEVTGQQEGDGMQFVGVNIRTEPIDKLPPCELVLSTPSIVPYPPGKLTFWPSALELISPLVLPLYSPNYVTVKHN